MHVTGLDRLSATNSGHFKDLVKAQLGAQLRFVEVDCTELKFIDSEGLGALVSVHKVVAPRQGIVRLMHVKPVIRQFLVLLRFQDLLEMHD